MKLSVIVRIAALVAVAAYVAWMQSANPTPVALPGLLTLPLGLIVLLVASLTFVVTWVPAWWSALQSKRQVQRLERRIAELESHLPSYDTGRSTPVIPDRVKEGASTTSS